MLHRRLGDDVSASALSFPPLTWERNARIQLLARELRAAEMVRDEVFDQIYPPAVRRLSWLHWSPMRACVRAVKLLALTRETRLLDVGAGAGKFCIVAASMSGARIRGIERSPYFAQVARAAAVRLGVTVDIVDGTLEDEAPSSVDALYFFNPFAETPNLPGVAMEGSRDERLARARRDVATAEAFLERADVGTRVVTFFGFGGRMPRSFERVTREACAGGVLELWEKRSVARRVGVIEPLTTETFAARSPTASDSR
jgi:SAM-dependent methyltransferase